MTYPPVTTVPGQGARVPARAHARSAHRVRRPDLSPLDRPDEPHEGHPRPRAARGRSDDALVAALEAAIPGFELADEGLELDAGPLVDLLGVDGEGRLVLVLRAAGQGPSSVAAVLDVVAFAQRRVAVLTRHLANDRLRADLPFRLVVLAENYAPDVRRRLSALGPCGVELMEFGALRTASGEHSYVLPLGGEPAAAAPTVRVGLEPALAELGDEQRQKMRAIARRLERLDDGLEVQAARRSVSWVLGSEVLARVDFPLDAPPRGLIPGRSARTLGAPHDVELFLDEVVASYVDRAELNPRVEITPRARPTAKGEPAAPGGGGRVEPPL